MKKRAYVTAVVFFLSTAGMVSASDDNTAVIMSEGFFNTATVNQVTESYFNNAEIYQYGNINEAQIDQTFTDGSTAYIEQLGDFNIATILQDDSWGATASIMQSGFMNYADIHQVNFSDDATADIFQEGVANVANITQADSNDASAIISQFAGIANYAIIEQMSSYESLAEIHQTGSDNYATIFQGNFSGVGLNTALITQEGESDMASIDQSFADNSYAEINNLFTSSYNDASIIQQGDSQWAYAEMSGGSDSMISIAQTDSFNSAIAVSVGFGNIIDINQGTGSDAL